MDLRHASAHAVLAEHNRLRLKARGYTYRGDKLWSREEDAIISRNGHRTVRQISRELPHRTAKAIETRRRLIWGGRRCLKPWKTSEDRILRAHAGLSYVEIAKLLPGRSRNAVQGRAWYLGMRKGRLTHAPKPIGVPIYDQVRQRAHEDSLSMPVLDRELGTGKYFQLNPKGRCNWKRLATAVEFFGGKFVIDWHDI